MLKYLCCALLLLLAGHLPAQSPRPGRWLITGTLRDSTGRPLSGTVLLGDTLRRAQRQLHQESEALRLAEEAIDARPTDALRARREQLATRLAAVSRLMRDSTRVVHANPRTGRFRLWARPSDTLYVESRHHLRQHYRVADLPRRGRNLQLRLRPEPCVPYVACHDTTGREYAFIGRKVSLVSAPEPSYCNEPFRIIMDSRFTATYQLLEQLRGRYPHDTITFTVYDHYGWPAFRRYPQVLLFVREYCGRPIHQKYQFYPVYRTTDGRWAAPYNWQDHQLPELEPPIRPRPLAFTTPVVADVSRADSAYVARRYPAPYYRVEHGQAVAVYGNYVDEIMENRRRLEAPRQALLRRQEAELRAVSPAPAKPRKPRPAPKSH